MYCICTPYHPTNQIKPNQTNKAVVWPHYVSTLASQHPKSQHPPKLFLHTDYLLLTTYSTYCMYYLPSALTVLTNYNNCCIVIRSIVECSSMKDVISRYFKLLVKASSSSLDHCSPPTPHSSLLVLLRRRTRSSSLSSSLSSLIPTYAWTCQTQRLYGVRSTLACF